jgi:hypothetical protein
MGIAFDRVGMATSTAGTGTLTLGSALGNVSPNLAAFMSFAAAGVATGQSVPYLILDSNNAWEVGIGVYTSSGTTLTRNVLWSSNANSAISLSGNAQVFITEIAEDINQAPQGSFRNKFRNATMDVWQRGTSSSTVTTAGAYTADGWIVVPTGASCTVVANGPEGNIGGLVGVYYDLTMTGATSVTDILVKQRIESYVAAPLANQTVTVQAWVFNNTGASITPTLTVKHAGAQDNWASPTTDVNAVSLQSCANGAWTNVAYTFASSGVAYNGLEVTFDFGNNFGTSGKSVSITACDIRVTPAVATGLNANPPPPELRPVAAELAFCQRYYYRRNSQSTQDYLAPVQAYASNAVFGTVQLLPVQLRAAPTTSLSAIGDISCATAAGSNGGAFTSGSLDQSTIYVLGTSSFSGTSGLSAGNCATIFFNKTTAWIAASAEL